MFVGQYAFLSNFYPVDRSGITVEHVFQARKATTEEDYHWIIQSVTPGQAKRRGGRIGLREDWENVKEDVMKDALLWKFRQRPFLDKLLATGESRLVEGNYWGDTYWGVSKSRGQNRLGELLMQVREELREEVKSYGAA